MAERQNTRVVLFSVSSNRQTGCCPLFATSATTFSSIINLFLGSVLGEARSHKSRRAALLLVAENVMVMHARVVVTLLLLPVVKPSVLSRHANSTRTSRRGPQKKRRRGGHRASPFSLHNGEERLAKAMKNERQTRNTTSHESQRPTDSHIFGEE